MSQAEIFNEQQAAFWNGAMGQTWVDTQVITDEMLIPAADLLVAEARELNPQRVLDIGCGNGTTTRAIATALPDAQEVTGIDISEIMMTHAQALSDASGDKARFIAADAASFDYAPGRYDLIVSRFGCMFFGDQVAALRQLRAATADNGKLCFVVWREPEANTFLTLGAKAAAGLLPDAPPRPDGAPSPFAMADETKMTARLKAAGWHAPRFEKVTFTFGFPEAYLEVFMRNLAPIGPGLDDLPDDKREVVFDRVRDAFSDYVAGGRLEYDAACLVIRANASA